LQLAAKCDGTILLLDIYIFTVFNRSSKSAFSIDQ
jgi:hypothetical protein